MNKITRMGIDLGKNTFHVCAMDRAGRVVLEKRFTRAGLAHAIPATGKRRRRRDSDSARTELGIPEKPHRGDLS